MWKYNSNAESPVTLQVHDANGVCQQLERLEPSEAHRMLDVSLTSDRYNKAKVEHLLNIPVIVQTIFDPGIFCALWYGWCYNQPFSKNWCTHCLLQRWVSVNAQLFSLTPLLQAALPTTGICWTFPWALVHAGIKALVSPTSYTQPEQGIAYIIQVLQHAHQVYDVLGQLMRGSHEQLTLELCLHGTMFSHSYQDCGLPCQVKLDNIHSSLVSMTFLFMAWAYPSPTVG